MKAILLFFITCTLLSCNYTGKKSQDINANKSNTYLTQGEHEIEIDGVKIWYSVRGNGPLLIVYPSSAGWGGDCSVYIQYLKPWEKKRTVLYLEPRGIGKSGRLNSMDEYTMEKYVDELELFRQKLGIERFDLFGHCYSGMISMKYALKHEQNINKMLILSSWSKLTGDWNQWASQRSGFDEMMQRFAEIETETLSEEEKLREIWKNTYTVSFYDYSRHRVGFEKILDETTFSMLPQRQFHEKEHPAYDITNLISAIKTKTLIIHGDDDFPMAIQGSMVMKENMTNSELLEIKNCCHWAFIEQPEQFFSETDRFLDN